MIPDSGFRIPDFRVALLKLAAIFARLGCLEELCTAISRCFKNEAFNISERYYSQSLLLFLNNMV